MCLTNTPSRPLQTEGSLSLEDWVLSLAKQYKPALREPHIGAHWEENGIYAFDPAAEGVIYAIDTPPPTVSGFLHLGHVYSYSHADFMARFWRMNGRNVLYPMGYDDNGLPTERLVERESGFTAEQLGRPAFIQQCLEISTEIERGYEELWKRLGLSIDWSRTYRTIDDESRRAAQVSFLELTERGLTYRQSAPTIWCPACHTAIAQAEVNDLERDSEFVTLAFRRPNGETLPIATTRPELLPACVAVFVHPGDARFAQVVGEQVTVPLFGGEVPVLEDPRADPAKGTGAVMCCTFGDTTDVEWWRTHHLPLREALDRQGRMTALAGPFTGMTVLEARIAIVQALREAGLLLGTQQIRQTVRVHERDDTPVEYIVTQQWFTRVLDQKDAFLAAGDRIQWYPAHMKTRYREWVENLAWDWCISRQRYYGVPFPVWYCTECGEVMLARKDQLPIDPTDAEPPESCTCGSSSFKPEEDVMDTWATSSLSPQIVGRWLSDPQFFHRIFPMALRAQAHEIIRTWAFYSIVKAQYHEGTVPWHAILISGWGLAQEGAGKISKSRGGGRMAPMELLERYSADAARYWAASTGVGKDALISEEKVQAGAKLVTKLWNVARFSERFLEGYVLPDGPPAMSPADRWIVSATHRLIRDVTAFFEAYDYVAAKNEIEIFFWRDLSDNYLEMAKKRLYDESSPGYEGTRYALYTALATVVKLFAPILPYVTDEIYGGLFVSHAESIHRSSWPVFDPALLDDEAEVAAQVLLAVATGVRRYKSDRNMSLGLELARIHLQIDDRELLAALTGAEDDISSVTRASRVDITAEASEGLEAVLLSVGRPLPVALFVAVE
jgi:valyl-tRNA synthetase